MMNLKLIKFLKTECMLFILKDLKPKIKLKFVMTYLIPDIFSTFAFDTKENSIH